MFLKLSEGLEWLFSSFDKSADTKKINELINQGYKYSIVVKKTWLLGLFTLIWYIPTVLGLVGLNIYILQKTFHNYEFYALSGILIINVVLAIGIFIHYLGIFKDIYGKFPKLENLWITKKRLEKGDIAFTRLHNQLLTNLLVFILMGIYIAYGLISNFSMWSILNIGVLIIQFFFAYSIIGKMIDLEMDFIVVTPGKKITYFNQTNLNGVPLSILSDSLKSSEPKHSPLFGQILNYGKIIFSSDGASDSGNITFPFTRGPLNTVDIIENLVKDDDIRINMLSLERNPYLSKILVEIGLNPEYDKNDKIFLKKHQKEIKKWLDENHRFLRDEVEKYGNEIKPFLRELYYI